MKPNYKRMADKWMHIHYAEQETIAELKKALKYAEDVKKYKEEIIEKLKHEIIEWKVKYADRLAENIHLLERIKALTEGNK